MRRPRQSRDAVAVRPRTSETVSTEHNLGGDREDSPLQKAEGA